VRRPSLPGNIAGPLKAGLRRPLASRSVRSLYSGSLSRRVVNSMTERLFLDFLLFSLAQGG